MVPGGRLAVAATQHAARRAQREGELKLHPPKGSHHPTRSPDAHHQSRRECGWRATTHPIESPRSTRRIKASNRLATLHQNPISPAKLGLGTSWVLRGKGFAWVKKDVEQAHGVHARHPFSTTAETLPASLSAHNHMPGTPSHRVEPAATVAHRHSPRLGSPPRLTGCGSWHPGLLQEVVVAPVTLKGGPV
mgnify:CR=1 FL=1